MTLLRYLDVMSCWKKGLGSPPEPTIWTDAASVANPTPRRCVSHCMNGRHNQTDQSRALTGGSAWLHKDSARLTVAPIAAQAALSHALHEIQCVCATRPRSARSAPDLERAAHGQLGRERAERSTDVAGCKRQ